MARAFLGVGGNLGDREQNIRAGLALLAEAGITVIRCSSRYETEPVGGPPQPNFLNAAAEVETDLSPQELLQALHRVEAALGRDRQVKWGPRTLDLDLLVYGQLVIDEDGLKVPHPLMHERRFVLEPLAEIAGDLVHPVLGLSTTELLQGLAEGASSGA